METNSQKVLEAMPSFDTFMELAEEIKKLSLSKMKLDNALKQKESENFREVMTNPAFFTSGKPIPVSHYENGYKFPGIGGNLLGMRSELASIQAELDLRKSEFEIYKSMHDLFKVLVYQERVLT